MPYFRSDMHSITLSVDTNGNGTKNQLGWLFATFEGGDIEADDAKVRPGGMGMEVSLGGPSSRNDATLTLPFSDVVLAMHRALEQAVINSAPCTASVSMLDRLRNAHAGWPTFSVTGTIKGAKIPDLDVGSGDPGMYQIVISCDEVSPAGG